MASPSNKKPQRRPKKTRNSEDAKRRPRSKKNPSKTSAKSSLKPSLKPSSKPTPKTSSKSIKKSSSPPSSAPKRTKKASPKPKLSAKKGSKLSAKKGTTPTKKAAKPASEAAVEVESPTPTRWLRFWNPQNPGASYMTAALLLSLVLWFVPFSGLLLYPVRLMVTFFHEAAHALATVLTGGSVESMIVHWDTSGVVERRGGVGFVISSAGYLGTTLLGALLVWLAKYPERIRRGLMVLGSTSAIMALLWGGSGPFATFPVALLLALALIPLYLSYTNFEWAEKLVPKRKQLAITAGVIGAAGLVYLGITGALLTVLVGIGGGAALLLMGTKAPKKWAHFGLSLFAVQMCFNALEDLHVLLGLSVSAPHVHTDAQNMEQALFLPASFWSLAWGAMAILIIASSLWYFYGFSIPESMKERASKFVEDRKKAAKKKKSNSKERSSKKAKPPTEESSKEEDKEASPKEKPREEPKEEPREEPNSNDEP